MIHVFEAPLDVSLDQIAVPAVLEVVGQFDRCGLGAAPGPVAVAAVEEVFLVRIAPSTSVQASCTGVDPL